MNLLQTTLTEKAGYDNGFENSSRQPDGSVELSSARHPARLQIRAESGEYVVVLQRVSAGLAEQLDRDFPRNPAGDYPCTNEAALHVFLRRAAALSRALPNQAVNDYLLSVADELLRIPEALHQTEVERTVRQRVGQEKFRAAMLDYWQGACAVTGVAIPELLRASHALPWAECQSDAQRLDVFNGFLLCAHLDALFDRFLISFDALGGIVFSSQVDRMQLETLGVTDRLRLRWLDERHQDYLDWHRRRLNAGADEG